MCGIAGIISKGKAPDGELRGYAGRLADSLRHRGPDDRGEFISEEMALVHLRLSIVDIAGGKQPIFNEKGTIGIVYNGEVYNYKALREGLRSKGYRFRTNSDTEVILRAYEAYGADSFEMLNGMFAFCIWDLEKKETYLARDPFGIKPLYLYEDGKRIIFSSELKALIALPDVDLAPDPAGFQDYLTFRYIQAPYTLFKNIRRLEAGTYLRIKNGVAARFRFWDISYDDQRQRPGFTEAKEGLAGKIEEAVASQLMGEVPIGVLLSGGVDSSAIAYFIHRAGARLKTFNIGFPDVNEFEYSRAVAKKYGLEHIEVVTTVTEMTENLDKVVLALDEPMADPACLPLYLLCRELKKHVTVVLSGEGGDELFAGYNQYKEVVNKKLPYSKRFEEFLKRSWYFDDFTDYLSVPVPAHNLRYMKYFDEQPLLNGMLSYDMKTWMPENLMMKADKILMAHSLEGRFPFLDRGLFDYASRLPMEFKLSPDGVSKKILKEALSPRLPDTIINRAKMGFTVPVAQLVKGLKPLVMEVFEASGSSFGAEVLNTDALKKLARSYYGSRNGPDLKLWTYFIMLYWFQFALPKYKAGGDILPGRTLPAP